MNKLYLFSNGLLALCLLLVVGTTASASPQTKDSHDEPSRFSRINQPFSLKVGVTLGGLGLIGAQLWWFMGKKYQMKQSELKQGIQELEVMVEGGYAPDYLVISLGTPVRISFLRKDDNACLERVLIPDFGIDTKLPLNEIRTVEFTPRKAGEYEFTCGMRMYRGLLKVKDI